MEEAVEPENAGGRGDEGVVLVREPVAGAAVEERRPGDEQVRDAASADDSCRPVLPKNDADVGPLGQGRAAGSRHSGRTGMSRPCAAIQSCLLLAVGKDRWGGSCGAARAPASAATCIGSFRSGPTRRSRGAVLHRLPGWRRAPGHPEGRGRGRGRRGSDERDVEELGLAAEDVGEPRPHAERGLRAGEAAEGADRHLDAIGEAAQAHQRLVGQLVGGEQHEPVARAQSAVGEPRGEIELQVAARVLRNRVRPPPGPARQAPRAGSRRSRDPRRRCGRCPSSHRRACSGHFRFEERDQPRSDRLGPVGWRGRPGRGAPPPRSGRDRRHARR